MKQTHSYLLPPTTFSYLSTSC